MKFSESWLRTLVDTQLSSEELSHLLTMAGLEVEGLEPVAPQFNDVVVALVLEVVKHTDADRLNVMLCSAKELGIAEETSGLLVLPADAPVGQSIREYLDLDDNQFELKLTPNRADCLSLTGVAREVAAIAGAQARLIEVPEVVATIDDQRAVMLDAPVACPLYCGRVIKERNSCYFCAG